MPNSAPHFISSLKEHFKFSTLWTGSNFHYFLCCVNNYSPMNDLMTIIGNAEESLKKKFTGFTFSYKIFIKIS